MDINAQVAQLFFVGLDVKVEENKEIPDLLSVLVRFIYGISKQSHKSLHKSSGKFGRSLIF
jgi:hypothetical protein